MPNKRQLVISKVCSGSKKADFMDHSYNKCAVVKKKFVNVFKNMLEFGL